MKARTRDARGRAFGEMSISRESLRKKMAAAAASRASPDAHFSPAGRELRRPWGSGSPHRPNPPLKLFSAWFCPFAQRAQIALEEKGVPYEYVECELYEGDASSKVALSLVEKRRRNAAFVEASPLGLVPALHDARAGARVHESHVCVAYVDEAFAHAGPPLLPSDPAARARVRCAVAYFDDKVRPMFYALLLRRTTAERAQAAAELTAGWAVLAARMAPESEGPFFLGECFSVFECAVLPWFQRLECVLGHYRGYELPDEPAYARLRVWFCACCDREGACAPPPPPLTSH